MVKRKLPRYNRDSTTTLRAVDLIQENEKSIVVFADVPLIVKSSRTYNRFYPSNKPMPPFIAPSHSRAVIDWCEANGVVSPSVSGSKAIFKNLEDAVMVKIAFS